MDVMAWILLLIGLSWWLLAWQRRIRAGFGRGAAISHDNVRLRSRRLRLVGQSDRIVKRDGYVIPEEKKPGLRV